MSVLLETSKGDLVIDLFVDDTPETCKNFLKLCKIKYYNNCLFFNVQRNFIVQSGDPTNTGRGGSSINGVLYGDQARFIDDEIQPHIRHKRKGMVAMAGAGENTAASQFYITTGEDLSSLDDKHTIFGEIAEGHDVLSAIDAAPVDASFRPLQNIRIRHSIVLEDPFPDPPALEEHIPEASPPPQFEHGDRIEDDWQPTDDARPTEEVEKETRRAEAHNRAVVLEMIGDVPDAEAKPPSDMLFICKLNPVTTEEDLETIFSRFGRVTSCDIIRDAKTGDSLCYAFIGFEDDAQAEEAYLKMNNVLIDDRRIKVDFSQSMHHLWKQFKRFGKRGGDAGMAAEANGGGNRYEMRSMQHAQHGGRNYDLLIDTTAAVASPRNALQHRDKRRRHNDDNGVHSRQHAGSRRSDDGEPPRSRHSHRGVQDYDEDHSRRHKHNGISRQPEDSRDAASRRHDDDDYDNRKSNRSHSHSRHDEQRSGGSRHRGDGHDGSRHDSRHAERERNRHSDDHDDVHGRRRNDSSSYSRSQKDASKARHSVDDRHHHKSRNQRADVDFDDRSERRSKQRHKSRHSRSPG